MPTGGGPDGLDLRTDQLLLKQGSEHLVVDPGVSLVVRRCGETELPSLLAGVLHALFTTTPPRRLAATAMRALLACFSVAVPPLLLFAGIGILLAAVRLPGTVDALVPIVSPIIPTNPWLSVLVLASLAPLALYRGPFNVYGMGAGHAAILIFSGGYAPPVALGVMASYNQVLGVSDPTSTQTVWSAQFSGVRPEKVMLQTLPYTWLVAIGGLIFTAARFLRLPTATQF